MAARYETYEDEVGEWRWRLIAANGEIVGTSSEPYRDQTDARRAVDDAATASAEASVFLIAGGSISVEVTMSDDDEA